MKVKDLEHKLLHEISSLKKDEAFNAFVDLLVDSFSDECLQLIETSLIEPNIIHEIKATNRAGVLIKPKIESILQTVNETLTNATEG